MERGTVEWNSGMVERAINDPVPFYLQLWLTTLYHINLLERAHYAAQYELQKGEREE